MARFLVDESLPRAMAEALRGSGHEVDHVLDIGLRGAPDSEIYRKAQELAAILISRDLGFANIRQFPPGTHVGIVVARMPSLASARWLASEIAALLEGQEDELKGAITIAEPGRIRIRRKEG